MMRGPLTVVLVSALVMSLAVVTGGAAYLATAPSSGPLFAGPVYPTGTSPRSVTIGDLDGDSHPDLAVANWGSSTVSVLLNNGDGTFAARTDYPTGGGPWSVAIGDLDGDFHPDLAVANYYSNTVSVLLNNGDGTFAARADYPTGDYPRSVAIGDLDGDSHPDLAVANYDDSTVSVLLNNGDGTFATRINYIAGGYPTSVAIGDLNGDGHPDLAVANEGGNTVSVLLNNGDGTFAARTDYPTGSHPVSVAIGDLDGDSHPDLAVANEVSNTVSVLLNNGDGHGPLPPSWTTFRAGWNLFSLPVDPVQAGGDFRDTTVLGDDISPLYVYWYDPTPPAGYDVFDTPATSSFAATLGLGYWVRVFSDTDVDVEGVTAPDAPFTIHLLPGWNVIGDPFTYSVSWGDVQVSYGGDTASVADAHANGWIYKYLYQYDGGGYSYEEAPGGVLEPWRGYWVKSLVEADLIIPAAVP